MDDDFKLPLKMSRNKWKKGENDLSFLKRPAGALHTPPPVVGGSYISKQFNSD